MTTRHSILYIFAHPDDETFCAAGAACRYAEAGIEVNLVTATRGDKGKTGDPSICKPEELAQVREEELKRAAQILGIHNVHLLDYKDKELAQADPVEIRAHLVKFIRLYRPQVVVTFDPQGVNLHPDHVAISRFASDALAAAADERWFTEAGAAHIVQRVLWTPPKPFWEVTRSSHPADEPGVDFYLDVSRYWQRKAEALRAHRSQNINIDKLFFEQPDTERILSYEAFRLGGGVPPKVRPADDLFADIV